MTLLEKKEYVEQNIKFLPASELQAFNFNFACVLTKNSVGMESGHTAKLEEVVSVVKGTPMSTLDEDLKRNVYNHYGCFEKVKKDAQKKEPLTEEFVKDLHRDLVNGIFQGGLYRNVSMKINGSKYIPCDPIKVYDRMHKYIEQVNMITDPIEKAVYAHLQLHKIHPFLDGNGRTSRLILEYVLFQEGYLPVSVPAKRRNEYFATLEIYKVEKNAEPFKNLLVDLLNKEYDRLIELITPYVK